MSLVIDNISKRYHKTKKYVLKSLTLNIENNTINSIVGINGAGKSTLIKSILGLIKINTGSINFNGGNINELIKKDKVGFLPEFLEFSKSVKLYDYLRDMSIIKGMDKATANKKIDELLYEFDLSDNKNHYISNFSKGMKKKVGFIQSILHEPELLILDEPTDGLDPISRRKMLDYIKKMSETCTILITSHILADLELISDNVYILSEGQILDKISRNEYINNEIDIELLFSDKHTEKFKLLSSNNSFEMNSTNSEIIDEIKINSSYKGLEDIFMSSLQRNRGE